MVNRREFFGKLIPRQPGPAAPRRDRPARMRSLETFVVVDAIPYDIHLTDEQEQSLRKQVRSLLEATPNDELFSAAVIPRLEELAATFLGRLENRD